MLQSEKIEIMKAGINEIEIGNQQRKSKKPKAVIF